MSRYGKHPPLSAADDPSNSIWYWFLYNGPHGERFEWHKSSVAPRDVNLLRESIARMTEYESNFPIQAREVALKALENDDTIVIRTSIQVLAILGTEADLEIVSTFLSHLNQDIVKDAQCCLFEIGIKLKRKT